jgi:hypothetical protein
MNCDDIAVQRLNNAVDAVPFALNDNTAILCPNCDSSYLHHEEILINARAQDSDTGTCVHVSGIGDYCCGPIETKHIEQASMALSISPRRGGLLITFWCECCQSSPKLAIYQHKGETILKWYNFLAS